MSVVVKAVKSVVKAAVKVVKKVVNTVVDVVKAAIKDPITTIAKVAAYATGNVWAIPLIDGVSTVAKGGSLGDGIKAAVISYGTQVVAGKVGTPVGKAAGNFAASQGASAATQQLVTNIVTRGVGNAAVAVITKQDPVKAFVSGGVSAAAGAVLGQIPGFDKQPAWVQNTVSSSIGAFVSGQKKFDEAAASILVATSGIVTEAIKLYDPDGTKLTAGQRAVATDAIFKTTSAALAGRDPSAALTQSLTNAATRAIGTYANEALAATTSAVADGYSRISSYGQQMDTVASASTEAANRFNEVNGSLKSAVSEQDRLYQAQVNARAAYEADPTDANYSAAEASVDAYNNYASALSKSYEEYYKPTLEGISSKLTGYQTEYDALVKTTTAEQVQLKGQLDGLNTTIDAAYDKSNQEFADALLPGFDAEAYRALNPNIPKDEDPYLHYITTGQFDGNKGTQAQLKESTDIIDSIMSDTKADESALQAYIESGAVTKDFAAAVTKKSYDDLVRELDTRVTTNSEAADIWKAAGFEENPTERQLTALLKLPEDRAQEFAGNTVETAKYMGGDSAAEVERVMKALEAGDKETALNTARFEGYTPEFFGAKRGETWDDFSKNLQEQTAAGDFKQGWNKYGDGSYSITGQDGSLLKLDSKGNVLEVVDTADQLALKNKTQDEMTPEDWRKLYATPTTDPVTGKTIVGVDPDFYSSQYDPKAYGGDPDLGWDARAQQLLYQENKGELPSQWAPGPNGTYIYTADDGSTLTLAANGEVLSTAEAPAGMLLSDLLKSGATAKLPSKTPAKPPAKPSTTPASKPPATTFTNKPATQPATKQVTKAPSNTAGANNTDLSAFLAALGGSSEGENSTVAGTGKENDADVQLMENIFGTSLDLTTPTTKTANAAKGGSVYELLQHLRG
jgi:hypothetical protein